MQILSTHELLKIAPATQN